MPYSDTPTTTGTSKFKPTGSIQLRSCNFCKKLKIPTVYKFKNCSDCRERAWKVKEIKDRRRVLGTMSVNNLGWEVVTSDTPKPIGHTSVIKDSSSSSRSLDMSMVVCKEYQTSSELLGALNNISTSESPSRPYLQFHGSYTIVTVPHIDNFQRVWLLANKLSAKPWLSFRFKQPLSQSGDESIQTLCFACTCTETVAIAPSTLVPHKTKTYSGNDENACAVSATTSSPNDILTTTAPDNICGGVITFQSIVDHTHPLGIPGQHIVVRVEHPVTSPSYPRRPPYPRTFKFKYV